MKVMGILISLTALMGNEAFAYDNNHRSCGNEISTASEPTFVKQKLDYTESNSINQEFSYATFGVCAPIPVPFVGFGYRNVSDSLGFDISGTVGTAIFAHSAGLGIQGLTFFERNYIGWGGGIGYVYVNNNEVRGGAVVMSPGVCFGMDRQRGFHQINLSGPSYFPQIAYLSFVPGISYQYGIKF